MNFFLFFHFVFYFFVFSVFSLFFIFSHSFFFVFGKLAMYKNITKTQVKMTPPESKQNLGTRGQRLFLLLNNESFKPRLQNENNRHEYSS